MDANVTVDSRLEITADSDCSQTGIWNVTSIGALDSLSHDIIIQAHNAFLEGPVISGTRHIEIEVCDGISIDIGGVGDNLPHEFAWQV